MDYLEALKKYLLYESKNNKKGGVYEYIQREFAYNTCKMDGCRLTKGQIAFMFELGQIDTEGEPLRGEDVVMISECFSALKQAINETEQEQGPEPEPKDLEALKNIVEDNIKWRSEGGDRRTGLIRAFRQCLSAGVCPFIIHAENEAEYESALDSVVRLQHLFRREQMTFYRETLAMVVDQV